MESRIDLNSVCLKGWPLKCEQDYLGILALRYLFFKHRIIMLGLLGLLGLACVVFFISSMGLFMRRYWI